jgi:hypothetical protein
MSRRSSLLLVLFSFFALTVDAGTSSKKLKVFVTNDAGSPPLLLFKAQQLAAQLLGTAGVESSWKLCPTANTPPPEKPCVEEGSLAMSVRILRSDRAGTWQFEPRSCGAALTGSGVENGFVAIIDASCIDRMTRYMPKEWVTALGHVIAHEIGHLLLGPGSHTTSGIMSAQWTEAELALLVRGQLRFTAKDAVRLRHAMSLRAANATEALARATR